MNAVTSQGCKAGTQRSQPDQEPALPYTNQPSFGLTQTHIIDNLEERVCVQKGFHYLKFSLNLITKLNFMLPKGEHIEGVPSELQKLLNKDKKAMTFFDTLSKSYKQGYCDWVGSAKQEATREVRAGKALKMLQNEQKTLKT